MAYKSYAPKGMLIAAFVVASVGTIISGIQLFTIKTVGDAIIEGARIDSLNQNNSNDNDTYRYHNDD